MSAGRFLIPGAVAAALMLAGCGIPLTSDDLPPQVPDITVGAPEPTASGEAEGTSEFVPTDELECESMPDDLLSYIESIGNVGGAVRYTEGQMVAFGDGWWAVAVRSVTEPGSDYDPESYPPVAYYSTTAPGVKRNELPRGQQASGDTVQHRLAASCLG